GIPATSEAGQPFALRLPRLGVLDEVIERVTVVGDLRAAVDAADGADELGARAGDRRGLAVGDQRRPVLGAVAVARAPAAVVVGPQIEGLSLRVDEHATEPRLADLDDCSRSAGGGDRGGCE